VPFDGDLDDYRDYVLSRRRTSRDDARASEADASRTVDRKAPKRAEAQARQRQSDVRKPFLARQSALEKEMETLAAEKVALDGWLATPEAYAEGAREKLKTALARQGEITWTLARLESQWLELAEALERAQG
jgi:ATP-binding cassette subfamily F protein 3